MQAQTSLEEIQGFKGKYPKQLLLMCLTEMWERFCFYGNRGILTIFMIEKLLLDEKSANLKYGAIQAFVYAFAFVGGLFADKILGFRRSLFFGGILMIAGNAIIAASPEHFFYIGICFTIVGTGFFKPNISSMVGTLYKENDPRQDAGFGLFYSAINVGALFGGILMVYLARHYSWSAAFGAASIVMMLGLVTFVYTQRSLGPIGLKPEMLTKNTRNSDIYSIIVALASLGSIWFILKLIMNTDYTDLFMYIIGPVTLCYYFYEVYSLNEPGQSKPRIASILLGLIHFFNLTFMFFVNGGKMIFQWLYGHEYLTHSSYLALTDSSIHLGSIHVSTWNIIRMSSLGLLLFFLSIQVWKHFNIIQKRLMAALIFILFSIVFWAFFEQSGGSLSIFALNNLRHDLLGMSIDPNMVNNSSNTVFVIVFSFLVGLLWIWMNKKKIEPNTILKFGLGFLFLAASFYILFYERNFVDAQGKTDLNVFTSAYLVMTIGELCLSPIGLSTMTKLSPKRLWGVMMGLWFLASAYGQYVAGLLGAGMVNPKDDASLTEKLMSYTDGYHQLAIYALICGVVLILISPAIKKLMGSIR